MVGRRDTEHLPKAEYYASTTNMEEAQNFINDFNFDLLFLDLQVDGGNGMTLIEEHPEIAKKTILCTSSDSIGVEALKAGVFYYILKPIQKSDVIIAFNKYLLFKNNCSEKELNLFENKLIIPDNNGIEFIPIESIIRLEAEQNYTRIFLDTDNSILISKTLKIFEDILERHSFLRIHRSHLINPNFIKRINKKDGGSVVLTTNESFKLSQSGKQELKLKMKMKI